jgi:hypothetical protein
MNHDLLRTLIKYQLNKSKQWETILGERFSPWSVAHVKIAAKEGEQCERIASNKGPERVRVQNLVAVGVLGLFGERDAWFIREHPNGDCKKQYCAEHCNKKHDQSGQNSEQNGRATIIYAFEIWNNLA